MGGGLLTQSGARDLAKHDITVTGFARVVATEMWEQVDQDLMEIGAAERPGQAMEEFSAEILQGRVSPSPKTSPGQRRFSRRGQRLHDRPDRDDRRRHDAGLRRQTNRLGRIWAEGKDARGRPADTGRRKAWPITDEKADLGRAFWRGRAS
jgi:hypothetical protein